MLQKEDDEEEKGAKGEKGVWISERSFFFSFKLNEIGGDVIFLVRKRKREETHTG